MHICSEPALHLPIVECDACENMLDRIQALEAKLAGKEDIVFSKTDSDSEITVSVLGRVES